MLAIAVAMLSITAQAAPVRWTLAGVTFDDGATASGSFVFDAATNQYSSISITTTSGASVNGATFTFVCQGSCTGLPPNPGSGLFLTTGAADLTGTPGLALLFSPLLSNTGGTVSVLGQQGSCSDAVCSAPTAPTRSVNAGDASGVGAPAMSVPAMSPWGVAALAALIGALALHRRRPKLAMRNR